MLSLSQIMDKPENAMFTFAMLAGAAVLLSATTGATRMANKHRNRQEAMARIEGYSASEFRRRFRMSRERFNIIVEDIRSKVQPMTPLGIVRAIASSGGIVHAELRLAATLRILSGGSYLDAGDLCAIHPDSIMESTFWPVCQAIVDSKHPALDTILFPFDDEMQLRLHEATFKKKK